MKRRYLLIVVALLLCQRATAQQIVSDDACRALLQEFEQSIPTEEKMSKALLYAGPYPETTDGASITAFYEGSRLRILEIVLLGENGKRTMQYLFRSPQEFIIKDERLFYASPIIFGNTATISRETLKHHYCGNGTLENTNDPALQKLLKILKDVRYNDRVEEAWKSMELSATNSTPIASRMIAAIVIAGVPLLLLTRVRSCLSRH